ncbi:ERC protein 2-like isoform X2 [Homarus americanus]|uniref:ERC protein 2-like isoform X2 n=1 Tax=Homarus americanus TaxID=6706 RepID=UPI001C47CDB2|nr:ERC protein 2-like isoform X2 [Homarus americanus]
MANNYTALRTAVSNSSIPSDFANGEQDSDSMWGSVSECHSDAGSQNISSVESASHNLLTVRPNPGALSVTDEKIVVSKDVKEVCNSTIKESASDNFEIQIVPQQKTSRGGSEETEQNLPQASDDLREVSVAVHDECSSMLSLALTSTSSLGRLTRLLRQVTTLQLSTDTPRVAENVLEELMEFENQHSNLEGQLGTAAAQLQMAVAQVQGIEILIGEQQQETLQIQQSASQLLGQVESGLESSGLRQMVAITSPRRRSTSRMLEDISSALTVLLGELNRKTLRSLKVEEERRRISEELQTAREAVLERESRLRTSEHEVLRVKERNRADITSLRQCLAQAEENLRETQLEKIKISEISKKEAVENAATVIQLQHKLSDLQREADSRVSQLEHRLQDTAKEKQTLESTLVELKNNLNLRTKQINLIDEENTLLIEGLRSTIKQQQEELDQLRLQLDSSLTHKKNLSYRVNELESELSTEQEQHQKLIKEISALKASINNLKLEHSEREKDLQDKIDTSAATRCELEGQIRSLDLTILQLRTELQMEKHRSTALSEETGCLQKKVKDLQDRIWSQVQRRRNNSSDSSNNFSSTKSSDSPRNLGGSAWGKEVTVEYGSCLSPLPTPTGTHQYDEHVQCMMKEVGDGQAREEQLHTLLREKDAALHSLQQALSTKINTKNQELEMLTSKISILEDQLGSLLSGLEASAAIGNITTEVGRLLQDRTCHLNSLDHSSQWLQEEMSSLALENQTLNNELLEAKRHHTEASVESQESARRARQEAREERLSAAHLREKCLELQAKLDSVEITLDHERQERRLSETVHGVKHREFRSLLDSAAALQQALDAQEQSGKMLENENSKT